MRGPGPGHDLAVRPRRRRDTRARRGSPAPGGGTAGPSPRATARPGRGAVARPSSVEPYTSINRIPKRCSKRVDELGRGGRPERDPHPVVGVVAAAAAPTTAGGSPIPCRRRRWRPTLDVTSTRSRSPRSRTAARPTPPAQSVEVTTAERAVTWNSGKHRVGHVVVGRARARRARRRRSTAPLRLEWVAPFDGPDVPLVYITYTGSCSARFDQRPAASPRHGVDERRPRRSTRPRRSPAVAADRDHVAQRRGGRGRPARRPPRASTTSTIAPLSAQHVGEELALEVGVHGDLDRSAPGTAEPRPEVGRRRVEHRRHPVALRRRAPTALRPRGRRCRRAPRSCSGRRRRW